VAQSHYSKGGRDNIGTLIGRWGTHRLGVMGPRMARKKKRGEKNGGSEDGKEKRPWELLALGETHVQRRIYQKE